TCAGGFNNTGILCRVGPGPIGEPGGGFFAQSLDVECSARGCVFDATGKLCRAAFGVWTTKVDIAFFHGAQFSVTRRTLAGHHKVDGVVATQRHDWAYDFWNDVPGFAQHHGVTNFDAFGFHHILVMQGGHRHGRAIHKHRFHNRIGGDSSSPSDVDQDVEQFGVHFFRWIFVGHRPSRRPRGITKLLLIGHAVDFDHDAIDLVDEVMTVFAVVANVMLYLFGDLVR